MIFKNHNEIGDKSAHVHVAPSPQNQADHLHFSYNNSKQWIHGKYHQGDKDALDVHENSDSSY
jgi:hypothetical protein